MARGKPINLGHRTLPTQKAAFQYSCDMLKRYDPGGRYALGDAGFPRHPSPNVEVYLIEPGEGYIDHRSFVSGRSVEDRANFAVFARFF